LEDAGAGATILSQRGEPEHILRGTNIVHQGGVALEVAILQQLLSPLPTAGADRKIRLDQTPQNIVCSDYDWRC
jgi:hypothetical protein